VHKDGEMTLAAEHPNIEFITEQRAIRFPDEWYEANSEDHFWFEWRARMALALIDAIGLPAEAPLKVLDVGCGTGITCRQLARHTQWTFDGADLNLNALTHCDVGRGRIFYYDLLEKRRAFKDGYDVAILFDVLEHIEETQAFLEALLYHLKPGGVLLVNVPALMTLYGVYDEVAGHYRRYTKATLAQEFVHLDVTMVRQLYWGFSMLPLLWLRQRLLHSRTRRDQVIRTGFVPPHPWVHSALRATMAVETALIKSPPLGSSVMCAVRKSDTSI
jgi:2-polyprenyl-3-methyl-5-hydroxy-6-metoxy-1,4-benzoquinol methylase